MPIDQLHILLYIDVITLINGAGFCLATEPIGKCILTQNKIFDSMELKAVNVIK